MAETENYFLEKEEEEEKKKLLLMVGHDGNALSLFTTGMYDEWLVVVLLL